MEHFLSNYRNEQPRHEAMWPGQGVFSPPFLDKKKAKPLITNVSLFFHSHLLPGSALIVVRGSTNKSFLKFASSILFILTSFSHNELSSYEFLILLLLHSIHYRREDCVFFLIDIFFFPRVLFFCLVRREGDDVFLILDL